MRTHLTLVSFLAMFAVVGCTAPADEPSSESAESSDSDLTADGKAEAVTWEYTDQIGRGVVAHAEVPGTVQLKLVGAPRPISKSNAQFDMAGLSAQTAVVRLVIPSPGNPNATAERIFFVRYIVSTRPDGTTLLSASAGGVGTVVDASLPNAVASFNATYNATTQTLVNKQSLRADDGMIFLDLTLDANGNFKPFYSNSSSRFGVGGAQQLLSDHALHTRLVYLKR